MNRRKAPETLLPGEAANLRRVDLQSDIGVVRRGKGCTRVDFTTGEATSVSSCEIFQRRDGAKIAVFGILGGTWKAQVRLGPAFQDSSY